MKRKMELKEEGRRIREGEEEAGKAKGGGREGEGGQEGEEEAPMGSSKKGREIEGVGWIG